LKKKSVPEEVQTPNNHL